MNRILVLLIVFISISFNLLGQIDSKYELIYELTKLHSKYNMSKDPSDSLIDKFTSNSLYKDNQFLVDFIIETVSSKNNILSRKFLSKPNLQILNELYAINQLSYFAGSCSKEKTLIILEDNIRRKVDKYVLLENYYSICFSNLGNIYNPLDLSDIANKNFNLDSLGLENDTEKAIFFLHYARWCNIFVCLAYNTSLVNETILKDSFEYLNSYPTINNKKYFYYKNFDMENFPLIISDVSFKEYYLQLYGQLLTTHLKCCRHFNDNKTYKEIMDSSIINVADYRLYLENIIIPDTVRVN